MTIETNCWVYPYCDFTNGGSPLFRAGSLVVEAGSGFNADGLGYRWAYGPGIAANARGGGGYGGQGGAGSSGPGGPTYGSSNAPVAAGSGGQNDTLGGPGGGAIRLEVDGHVDLDGTLTANGGRAPGVHGAGGSGGSVFILCNTLDGAPGSLLRARGGHSSSPSHLGGGGGGGRIAVGVGIYRRTTQYSRDEGVPLYISAAQAGFTGTANVTGGTQTASYTAPEVGTVVFYKAPPTGTVILVR